MYKIQRAEKLILPDSKEQIFYVYTRSTNLRGWRISPAIKFCHRM